MLVLDILLNHFIRHIPAAAAKIPPRPHSLAPILLPQLGIFPQQLVRGRPLQSLHQSAYRHLRGNREEQMDMILRDISGDDFYSFPLADLTDQFPYPVRLFSFQHGFSLFCDPHHMQRDRKDRMRAMSIFTHGGILPNRC